MTDKMIKGLAGHHVTALARSPEKLPRSTSSRGNQDEPRPVVAVNGLIAVLSGQALDHCPSFVRCATSATMPSTVAHPNTPGLGEALLLREQPAALYPVPRPPRSRAWDREKSCGTP
jgi:hypothetical protein